MITIAETVQGIITRSPFLEEALSDNLLNISSLARKILPEVQNRLKKPIKEGAIIMAINRLSLNYYDKINIGLKDFVRHLGDFIVRSDLMDFTFRNSESLRKKQALLLQQLQNRPDIFYTFSQGINETTIIISDAEETLMDELFKHEVRVSKKKNLSSITLNLPVDNTEVSGFYYYILKNLAWEGVNIMEVISTTNEFTLVVQDQQINKAFTILMGLKKGTKVPGS